MQVNSDDCSKKSCREDGASPGLPHLPGSLLRQGPLSEPQCRQFPGPGGHRLTGRPSFSFCKSNRIQLLPSKQRGYVSDSRLSFGTAGVKGWPLVRRIEPGVALPQGGPLRNLPREGRVRILSAGSRHFGTCDYVRRKRLPTGEGGIRDRRFFRTRRGRRNSKAALWPRPVPDLAIIKTDVRVV
jgi:hypothetical protein